MLGYLKFLELFLNLGKGS